MGHDDDAQTAGGENQADSGQPPSEAPTEGAPERKKSVEKVPTEDPNATTITDGNTPFQTALASKFDRIPLIKSKLQVVDKEWEIPLHIIYSSTDLITAKRIIPFVKQLIWRVVETTRDLDPKNDVRYLRLVSDVNEVVVMPMFPRHFLVVVQEPRSEPNVLFENMGIVTTHPQVKTDDSEALHKHHKNKYHAAKAKGGNADEAGH
ncbi:uncharacterized protein LOC129586856 [Paramacrobiotus metropolitanus]|uniref:uncharacterized protein LOC129586856 n=1 Tax=Paramacrobiotus metropolitanus TaxID=2943436 RepID=UPI002445B684|nr:uncharacterized protein LOC129586856 [Paramacrobiotus metropolitanus]